MAIDEKTLRLCLKIKGYADRGIDGEKENATEMLRRFMEKHGITMRDIEGDIKSEHIFFINPDHYSFFYQIASSVLGKNFDIWEYKRINDPKKKNVKRYGIKTSDSLFIEIMAKFEFFNKKYLEDMKAFRSAFIQKNHLYQYETDEEQEARDKQDDQRERTPEEKAESWKIANMMNGLDRHKFNKQIE